MARGAFSLSEKEALARLDIARSRVIDRRSPQCRDIGHKRVQLRLRKRKGRHATLWNAVLDHIRQILLRAAPAIPLASLPRIHDIGAAFPTTAINAVASGAAGFERPLARHDLL